MKYSILLLHMEDYTFFRESIVTSFGVIPTLQTMPELRLIFTVPDKPLKANQEAFLKQEAINSKKI